MRVLSTGLVLAASAMLAGCAARWGEATGVAEPGADYVVKQTYALQQPLDLHDQWREDGGFFSRTRYYFTPAGRSQQSVIGRVPVGTRVLYRGVFNADAGQGQYAVHPMVEIQDGPHAGKDVSAREASRTAGREVYVDGAYLGAVSSSDEAK